MFIFVVNNKIIIMLYTKKIESGFYKVLDVTLGDQGWRLEKDNTLEGTLKWAINNNDYEKLNEFLEQGWDQLWQTKSEALERLNDYLIN